MRNSASFKAPAKVASFPVNTTFRVVVDQNDDLALVVGSIKENVKPRNISKPLTIEDALKISIEDQEIDVLVNISGERYSVHWVGHGYVSVLSSPTAGIVYEMEDFKYVVSKQL